MFPSIAEQSTFVNKYLLIIPLLTGINLSLPYTGPPASVMLHILSPSMFHPHFIFMYFSTLLSILISALNLPMLFKNILLGMKYSLLGYNFETVIKL